MGNAIVKVQPLKVEVKRHVHEELYGARPTWWCIDEFYPTIEAEPEKPKKNSDLVDAMTHIFRIKTWHK